MKEPEEAEKVEGGLAGAQVAVGLLAGAKMVAVATVAQSAGEGTTAVSPALAMRGLLRRRPQARSVNRDAAGRVAWAGGAWSGVAWQTVKFLCAASSKELIPKQKL